ncbi:hypothetical protein GCM10012275_56200 [Longimycelium tulufanense]|uniref:Terminase small subunit n=1 Tax=Longimycelium tulufanense TaxID=907463 RepID=A0A8J3CJS0_9PSEU|nr:phage terminase small subunit P27 family [Longimycelium tulufanense]GGM78313.1 hypothetical protein GCM10012275_56200 [Longimycelium tulufanense]
MSRAKAPENRLGRPRTAKQRTNPLPAASTGSTIIPEPPATLDITGRELWSELWRRGESVYTATDALTIERYCSLADRRALYLALLREEGHVTTGSTGQLVAHPAAKLLADVESRMLALEDRLGLNPDSRIRLGLGAAELRSELDDFLSQ